MSTNAPTSYFVVQNRIKQIMDAIQSAGVPERFTLSFLNSLGFKSTNDRPIVAVLKALDFLNQSGVPTQNYRDYKDSYKAPTVLARCIREAYSSIFLANEVAHTLSVEKLKGIFASVTGKGDSVALKMAQTFKTFCGISDFNLQSEPVLPEKPFEEIKTEDEASLKESLPRPSSAMSEFHYNIQIHLPVTSDISVYNAIFKSLREHLM